MLSPLPTYSQIGGNQWLRETLRSGSCDARLVITFQCFGTLVAGVCKMQWRNAFEDHTQIQPGQQGQSGFGMRVYVQALPLCRCWRGPHRSSRLCTQHTRSLGWYRSSSVYRVDHKVARVSCHVSLANTAGINLSYKGVLAQHMQSTSP